MILEWMSIWGQTNLTDQSSSSNSTYITLLRSCMCKCQCACGHGHGLRATEKFSSSKHKVKEGKHGLVWDLLHSILLHFVLTLQYYVHITPLKSQSQGTYFNLGYFIFCNVTLMLHHLKEYHIILYDIIFTLHF